MSSGFFLQAEDGIRDLVRSRGLGDVYKRQAHLSTAGLNKSLYDAYIKAFRWSTDRLGKDGGITVSYTHLTLPTSDLV